MLMPDIPTTRRRTIHEQSSKELITLYGALNNGTIPTWKSSDIVGTTKGTMSSSGTQVTVSEGHPFWQSKSKGKSDVGGNFSTQKKFVIVPNQNQSGDFSYNTFIGGGFPNWYARRCKYDCPLLAANPTNTSLFPPDKSSSSSNLDALGTTAISRVKPTNPIGGLLNALKELRSEGIPHELGHTLWEKKTQVARNAGDEYLNFQFGFVPLAHDISDFASTVKNSHSVIQQYKRGVGRVTRRQYDFPSTIGTSTISLASNVNPYYGPSATSDFVSGSGAGHGNLVVERTISQRRWFTGAFTYFLPDNYLGEKMGDYAILAQQLGLELTPEVLWNAAPWSWAIDWFSNAGDVISNFSAFHQDGLVMYYGYIMEHTTVSDTYRLSDCYFANGKPAFPADVTFVTETKLRRGATPYGFGLNFGALSVFQQSILAALGLSKGRR